MDIGTNTVQHLNDLGEAERTLSKFPGDTKLEGVAGTPERCADIQRVLDRLEKRADSDLMKFIRGKHLIRPLKTTNPMH